MNVLSLNSYDYLKQMRVCCRMNPNEVLKMISELPVSKKVKDEFEKNYNEVDN